MTAVAVSVLIFTLGFLLLVVWSMYSDERARRIRHENTITRLRADLHEARMVRPTAQVWRVTTPRRPRLEIPIQPDTPTEETPTVNTHRIRRRALPAVAVAVFGFLLSACYPQPATLHPFAAPTDKPQLALFGDSLGAMAQQPTEAILTQHGDLSVSYNAVGGTRLQHWFDAIANVPAGNSVMLELGTNNVTLDLIADTQTYLHHALDLTANAPCVVIPTLNTDGGDRRGWPYDVRTRAFNDELVRLIDAGTYPNLRVFDWNATAYGHPEWLMGTAANPVDWVHYNAEGIGHYAEMLAAAAEVCA